jgi:predicted nucleotidyltransferase
MSTPLAQSEYPFGLEPHWLDAIKEKVYACPYVERAVIFGSRAKGNYKRGSDVDIAVFGDLTYSQVSHIEYQLNEETKVPLFFDVIAYKLVENENLKDHIDRVGIEF